MKEKQASMANPSIDDIGGGTPINIPSSKATTNNTTTATSSGVPINVDGHLTSMPPSQPSSVYDPPSSRSGDSANDQPRRGRERERRTTTTTNNAAHHHGIRDGGNSTTNGDDEGYAFTYPHGAVYQVFKRTVRGTYAVFTIDSDDSYSSANGNTNNSNSNNGGGGGGGSGGGGNSVGGKLAGLSMEALTALADCLNGMNAVEDRERGEGEFVWVVTGLSVNGESFVVGMRREDVGDGGD